MSNIQILSIFIVIMLRRKAVRSGNILNFVSELIIKQNLAVMGKVF